LLMRFFIHYSTFAS